MFTILWLNLRHKNQTQSEPQRQVFPTQNKTCVQRKTNKAKTRLWPSLGLIGQHDVSTHDITSVIDRRVPHWQSHCIMPCWGLGLSHSFYATYGSNCPHSHDLISARHSERSAAGCPNSAHADQSERKWAGRQQGCCWCVFKWLTNICFSSMETNGSLNLLLNRYTNFSYSSSISTDFYWPQRRNLTGLTLVILTSLVP